MLDKMIEENNITKSDSGFTLIELILAFLVLVTLAVFFVIQRNDVEASSRDQIRKAAINSMYYALTEDFYKTHNYYPITISRDNLKSVDPAIFTDPSGYTLNGDQCTYTSIDDKQAIDGDCEYFYQAENCTNDGKCKEFKLTASLEKEGDYHKNSPKK